MPKGKQGFEPGHTLSTTKGGGKQIYGNRHNAKSRRFLTQQMQARLHEPVSAIAEFLDWDDDKLQTQEDMTIAASIVDRILANAVKGDNTAAAFIWERIEGKVPQAIKGEFTHTYDLSKLSDKELELFVTLSRKAVQIEAKKGEDYEEA